MRGWAWWVGLALLFAFASSARAAPSDAPAGAPIAVPALDGHVFDPDEQLAKPTRLAIDHELEDYRLKQGFAIVVAVVTSLHGESIDDFAYRAFNTWKIGEAGKDNGVLLVIATGDRRIRIETGRGVEGDLTDLQCEDIIHDHIAPAMQNKDLFGAIRIGIALITAALKDGKPGAIAGWGHRLWHWMRGWSVGTWTAVVIIGGIVILSLIVAAVHALMRRLSKRFRRWDDKPSAPQHVSSYTAGGGSSSSSSSESSSSSAVSSRRDVGSGYSGGGGSSGGGGASDSY